MGTHAIFALNAGTDDLVLALKAGAELVARGHDVWLYGRRETAEAALLEGIPFHEVDAEDVAGNIEAIAEESDSLLVADFLTTFSLLAAKGETERVRKLDKIIVLDPWNLGEGERVLDTPLTHRTLPKETLLTPKRLVPSFGSVSGASAFRAFPDVPEGDVDARRSSARRALGIAKDERVVLVTTTTFQVEAAHENPKIKQLVRRVLRLVVERLALIENTRVLHVGPVPLAWTEPLGDRYTWLVPPGTKHLHNRFAAADLVLVFDAAAASIGWAGAWKIPVMSIVNSHEVKTPETKLNTPFELTEPTVLWLADSTPLPRFRLCPLGLFQTLEATRLDLPYAALEILDETGFLDAGRALLFDETERQRALRDSASCMEDAASLPTAAELWEKLAST